MYSQCFANRWQNYLLFASIMNATFQIVVEQKDSLSTGISVFHEPATLGCRNQSLF